MSGIGHLAAGFIAKPAAPRAPLWLLLAAGEANDLLYFVFTATGLEKNAAFSMDFSHGVRYLAPAVAHPWSHGFLMSLAWSLLAAFLAYIFYKDRRTAGVIGLVVLSHWGLDFLMHANLPLFLSSTPLVGLGLENTGPGLIFMTLLDLVLVAASLVVYWRYRRRKKVLPEGSALQG